MFRVIHLDFYRTRVFEYVYLDLVTAKKQFDKIVEQYSTDTVVLENDEGHEILDHN